MAASSPRSDRWLWGPAPDLLLGCGALYGLLFLLLLGLGPEIRTDQPLVLFPLLILLVSSPHYGATLLRVYEQRRERKRYYLFAVWLSLAVVGLFFASLFSVTLASVLVTVLLTWSPYHYTGQNYGISVLFLKRRQIPVSDALRRILKLSFQLSFALIFVSINIGGGQPVATARGYEVSTVSFLSLNLPHWTLLPVLVAYLASLVAAAAMLLRVAPAGKLLPTALLMLTQALWFSLPVFCIQYGLFPNIEPLQLSERTYYFIWIALAHAIQYLWITSYFERSSNRWTGMPTYWSKALLAGAGVWTLPVLLLAPIGLGGFLPVADYAPGYEAGFALIVSSCVNIHHFMLDGVIWRLRNHRIARVLLRDQPSESDSDATTAGHGVWIRRGVWSLAGLALLGSTVALWTQSFSLPASVAKGDWQRAESAFGILDWLGHAEETDHLSVAGAALTAGDLSSSERIYREILARNPDLAAAHYGLAQALTAKGENTTAIAQYLEALAAQPGFAEAHYSLGNLLAKENRLDAAIIHYRAAITNKPDLVSAYNNLGTALLQKGFRDEAIKAYQQALVVEPGNATATKNLALVNGSTP